MIELGVIDDMESTLLPDDHTVKARGVWLVDNGRKTLFLESGAVSDLQHELSCLRDKIRELSDVGNIFDGCDHCNEYTHETNYKMLEAAMDKIYAIVTAPLPIDYDAF